MNIFYELNVDEVEGAIENISNVLLLKEIEQTLYNGDFSHMYNQYNYFDTRRDFEFESYNGIVESSLAIMFLDAIYKDYYSLTELCIDEGKDFYEELYYNFRIDKDDRIYDEEEFEGLCQSYVVLSLYTDAIKGALSIAETNRKVLDKILKLANLIPVRNSDLTEGCTVNLESKCVDVLLGNYSSYELEHSVTDLFNLELYCRKVVKEYGKN